MITHLLGYVDDVSACVPLKDLQFLCDRFTTIGAPLGCFVNPIKTRILTSTSGHSPIPDLHHINPTLTTSISDAISRYSTRPNDVNIIGPPLPAELTTGFCLLGSPVGYPAFAREYLNTQLIDIQTCITTMSIAITDRHTKLRLFSQSLIQKIPHLLGCNVLYYHYDTDEPPPDWTDWNGPLTLATNHIISRFISYTIGVTTLPHHSLLIAQLSLNAGGLGILDPRTRAIPDFMLTFTTSTRHATNRMYLNKHLNNVHLHPTIAALYSTNTNPHSLIPHPETVPSHSPKHRHIILPANHPPDGPRPILPYHPITP